MIEYSVDRGRRSHLGAAYPLYLLNWGDESPLDRSAETSAELLAMPFVFVHERKGSLDGNGQVETIAQLTNLFWQRHIHDHSPRVPQRRRRFGQGTAGGPPGVVPVRSPAHANPRRLSARDGPPAPEVAVQDGAQKRKVVDAPRNQTDGVKGRG